MDFSTKNVEEAVHLFYTNSPNQQEVNRWLMAAQFSTQAWSFSGDLLQRDKAPAVQFFGANTLHMKLARFWHEVPPEQVEALRSQLMDHVSNFASGPKMVLTRLCVAMSALTMHTMPDLWPDAVPSIINCFQNHPTLTQDEKLRVVLEMLTVMPEEFFTAYLTSYKKGVVRNELSKATPQVLSLLKTLLVPETPAQVYEQCMRCFSSWIQFGIPLADAESLIEQVFRSLHNDAFFDTAVETLVHVFAHANNFRQPNTVRKLLPLVIQLEEKLQRAKQETDLDTCQGLSKLIVTACAYNTRLILEETVCRDPQRQRMAISLVNMVLQCTAIPGYYPVDEICSDLPFFFWYNFQDDIIASEGEDNATLMQVYTPVYMSLISILLQKVQYPPEAEYNDWHSDEKESNRCYRQDIADTLMYAYSFLHDSMLCTLANLVGQILQKQAEGNVKWQEIEAVLFALASIAESVDVEEFLYLPTVFQHLNQIPCNNVFVITQALLMIGSYAEWLSLHPELISCVLPLVLQGLKEPTLIEPATLALRDIVGENQPHLPQFVSEILTAAKECLDTIPMSLNDSVRLMSSLGYVFSVLPFQECMSYLDILLGPQIQQLQETVTMELTPATKSIVNQKLMMISWLFSSLNIHWDCDNPKSTNFDDPQPVLLILRKLLPMLPSVLAHWVSDRVIVEAVCSILKRAMRTLMEDYAPLLPDTANLIVQLYSAHPNPSTLDAAKQLIILFADDAELKAINDGMFITLCEKSLELLRSSNVQDHTDLVESFMCFLGHIAKKNSKMFCHPDCNVEHLFQAGILGLVLPESATVKASCMFMWEFIQCGDRENRVKEVVAANGQNLVAKLLQAIGGESPRCAVDPMSDVFLALNKHHFQAHCVWMKELMKREGFPSPLLTPQQKDQFASKVLKERTNKKRLKECVNEFTLLCRGLLTTQYGLQTVMPPMTLANTAAAAAGDPAAAAAHAAAIGAANGGGGGGGQAYVST